MSQLRWALPLVLSVGLFSCGGEEPSAPAPGGGSEASEAAPESQDPAGTAAEALEDVTESVTAKADSLIEKITGYLESDKLDLAKSAFAQLVALKDKLPASYQAQIDKLSQLIEASGLEDKANDLINNLGGGGGGG